MKLNALKVLIGILTFGILVASPMTFAEYDITDLGTLGGNRSEGVDMNNSTQIIGNSQDGQPNNYPTFYWENGQMTSLTPLGIGGAPIAISNSGLVLASSWEDGVTRLWSLDEGWNINLQSISIPPYHMWQIFDVNSNGMVVGTLINSTLGYKGFIYQDTNGNHQVDQNEIIDLGPMLATHINEAGEVSGAYWPTIPSHSHAALWRNGNIIDLGMLPGHFASFTLGLNDNGQIVGYSTNNFNSPPQPMLWQVDSGGINVSPIQTLPGASSTLRFYGNINNHGDIVGSSTVNGNRHLCLWRNGQIFDLANLIPSNSGWQLSLGPSEGAAAVGSINDEGQILGTGYHNGQLRAFILTPVNHPPVLNPIGNKTVRGGRLLQFNVSATDPDPNTTLHLITPSLPQGATFVDNGNGAGTFSWRPAANLNGDYSIDFIVSDGDLTDHEQILIYVQGLQVITAVAHPDPAPEP